MHVKAFSFLNQFGILDLAYAGQAVWDPFMFNSSSPSTYLTAKLHPTFCQQGRVIIDDEITFHFWLHLSFNV